MRRSLLISVSGAFSTGKTTLVEALCEAIPESVTIIDGGRAARSALEGFDWEQPDARAFLYWYQLICEERASAQVILCDTSLIDVLAHHQLYGIAPPKHALLQEQRYDLALLCDAVEVPLTDDGLRDIDRGRRAQLDLLIRDHATRYAGRCVEISGKPSSRLERALDVVRTAQDDLARRV